MIPAELEQTLGDRLKKSLKHADMSVADMAEYLEVHRNTITNWLADRRTPMLAILRVWAEKVGLPVEWLRNGTWPETGQ